MSTTGDPEIPIIVAGLRRIAASIEGGNPPRLAIIADTARRAALKFIEREQAREPAPAPYYNDGDLAHAVHMLHEQAHGASPFSTCRKEPCRNLSLRLAGPAPLSLPV